MASYTRKTVPPASPLRKRLEVEIILDSAEPKYAVIDCPITTPQVQLFSTAEGMYQSAIDAENDAGNTQQDDGLQP